MNHRKHPFPHASKSAAIAAAAALFLQAAVPPARAASWAEDRRAARAQLAAAAPPSARPFGEALPRVTRVLDPGLRASAAGRLPAPLSGGDASLLNALSPALGSIRKISPARRPASAGRPAPVVVHIQDVHGNEQAQRNIGAALEALAAASRQSASIGNGERLSLVALEGAWGKLDLSGLRALPRRDWLENAADFLLRTQGISGPVHALLSGSAALPPVVGVDDPARHRANAEAYRISAGRMEGHKAVLSGLRAAQERRKASVFNPALRDFDAAVLSYRDGKTGLAEHLKTLAEAAGSRPPAVLSFLEALSLENAMDFKKVEAERETLIKALVERLSRERLDALVRWSASYRLGEMGSSDFYRALKGLCGSAGLDLKGFPAMDAYVRYVLAADRVDAGLLLEERAELERSAYAALARTPEEKALAGASRMLSLTAALLDFSLSPEEWEEYAALKAGRTLSDGDALDLSSFEAFYREACARDGAMARNLLAAMEAHPSGAAALVTGGFHGPGLDRLLTEAGCSVVTFVPRIDKVDAAGGAAYLSAFTREKAPLEALFQGRTLFLSNDPAGQVNRLVPVYLAQAAGEAVDEESLSRSRRVVEEYSSGPRRKLLNEAVENALRGAEEALGLKRSFSWSPSLDVDAQGRVVVRLTIQGEDFETKTVQAAVVLDDEGRPVGFESVNKVPSGLSRRLADWARNRIERLQAATGSVALAERWLWSLPFPGSSLVTAWTTGLHRDAEETPSGSFAAAVERIVARGIVLGGMTLARASAPWPLSFGASDRANIAFHNLWNEAAQSLGLATLSVSVAPRMDVWVNGNGLQFYKERNELLLRKVLSPEEADKLLNDLTVGDKNRLSAYYARLRSEEGLNPAEDLQAGLKPMANILRRTRQSDALDNLQQNHGLTDGQLDFLRGASEFILQFKESSAPGTTITSWTNEERLKEIKNTFARYPEASKALALWFEERFDPKSGNRAAENRAEALFKAAAGKARGLMTAKVFNLAAQLVRGTIRTDYFDQNRISLGFRLDPSKMDVFKDEARFPVKPYAVIWTHIPYGGWGAHVRFGNLARGGLRELLANMMKWAGVLEEAYNLAKAQNKKNINLLQMGSKGAFVMHEGRNPVAVAIAYASALMSFMEERPAVIVDRGGDPKRRVDPIEAGPDEGTATIGGIATAWAMVRKLRNPFTFMTGKPVDMGGFPHDRNNLLDPPSKGNHVTSQGVMEMAYLGLKEIGLNVKADKVVMKFTGGMDGDVAGGNVVQAVETYGDRAVMPTLTDGSGTIFDPEGLDHEELLRLYSDPDPSKRTLVHFNRDKLRGKGAFFVDTVRKKDQPLSMIELGPEALSRLNARPFDPHVLRSLGLPVPEGLELERDAAGRPVRARVSAPYFGRIMMFAVKADVFIPGGGAMWTINKKNWKLFFDEDGKPTARLIVYGANVYTAPEANLAFEESGISIVSDYWANNVGVEVSGNVEVAVNSIFRIEEKPESWRAEFFGQTLRKLLADQRRKYWAGVLEELRANRGGTARVLRAGQLFEQLSDEVTRLKGELPDSLSAQDPEVRTAIRGFMAEAVTDEELFSRVPEDVQLAMAAVFLANGVVMNAGVSYLRNVAKATGRSQKDVILAYARVARETGLEARKKAEVYDREGDMPMAEQIARLEEIERLQQEKVLEVLRGGSTPPPAPASGNGKTGGPASRRELGRQVLRELGALGLSKGVKDMPGVAAALVEGSASPAPAVEGKTRMYFVPSMESLGANWSLFMERLEKEGRGAVVVTSSRLLALRIRAQTGFRVRTHISRVKAFKEPLNGLTRVNMAAYQEDAGFMALLARTDGVQFYTPSTVHLLEEGVTDKRLLEATRAALILRVLKALEEMPASGVDWKGVAEKLSAIAEAA